jgi:hypothetical protein
MQTIGLDYSDFCSRSGRNPEQTLLVRDNFSVPGSWLAGGAIRRTLMGMPLDSDYDFFFQNEFAFDSFDEQTIGLGFKKTKETEHHNQYEGKFEGQDFVVQAIKFQFYSDAAEVLDSFDYTITQFLLSGSTLLTTPESLWDLARKRLALHKVTYPVATLRRMLKYSNQGFTACAGCMGDLFKMTIDNPSTWGTFDIQYID